MAEALAYAQATLTELGCEEVTVVKAIPHVVTHKSGTTLRTETLVVATLASEEEAAKTKTRHLKSGTRLFRRQEEIESRQNLHPKYAGTLSKRPRRFWRL